MLTHEEFLQHVNSAIARSGLSATEFGRQALGDPNFVFDLKRGRNCSLAVVGKVSKFIDGLPDKAEHPDVAA